MNLNSDMSSNKYCSFNNWYLNNEAMWMQQKCKKPHFIFRRIFMTKSIHIWIWSTLIMTIIRNDLIKLLFIIIVCIEFAHCTFRTQGDCVTAAQLVRENKVLSSEFRWTAWDGICHVSIGTVPTILYAERGQYCRLLAVLMLFKWYLNQ